MSAASLWLELSELGVTLATVGDKLRVDAPAGVLTPELRERLMASKGSLLDWLARPPLSFAQQRMWLLQQLAPATAAYNVCVAVRVRGPLEVDRLWSAVDELQRRHEVLRTRYPRAEDRPWAEVLPAEPSSRELVTLDEGDLEAVLRALARAPFDLERDAPWRPAVLRLGPADHVLVLATHHVAMDGWALQIVLGELKALLAGETLPPVSFSFVDHARRERAADEAGRTRAAIAHWRQRLAEHRDVLQLPFDREPASVVTGKGAVLDLDLGDRGARVGELARRLRTTPFAVYLAAYAATLHRWTGQDDIAIGTVVSARHGRGADMLVGSLANTIILRLHVDGDETFHALCGRAALELLDAFEHPEVPFERVLEALNVGGTDALFQTVLMLQRPSATPENVAGLQIEPLEVDLGTTRFDLTLQLAQDGERLIGAIEYSTALFDRLTIANLARWFDAVLSAGAADPSMPIRALPMFTREELERAARHGHGPEGDPRDVLALVQRAAAEHPALVAIDGQDEVLTYRELLARAATFAGQLSRAGAGPETVVAIRLPRSAGLVVAMLAALWCGAAFAVIDDAWPEVRAQAALARLAPAVTIDERWLSSSEDGAPIAAAAVPPETLAYVIFTSGSTGVPKAVFVPRRGIGNLVSAQGRTFGVRPGDPVLQFAAAGFDAIVSEVFVTLGAGGRVVIRRRPQLMPGDTLARTLADAAIAVVTLPPSAALVTPSADLEHLHTLVVAGEPCPERVVSLWATGGRRVVNAYGPTEVTVCATMTTCSPGEAPPIGRVLPGATAWVMDRWGGPLPEGIWGELVVGGLGVARGYAGAPDTTAERFRPDPERAGSRAYRTGDRVRWRSDGQLEFAGRYDEQVKVRGYRIEPGEVETALRRIAGVTDAAVVAVGEASARRLVAWVVTTEAFDDGDIRRRLAASIPAYMVPSTILAIDRLPTTTNGKVDRRALLRELDAPRREPAEHLELNTEESEILSIWRDALGSPLAAWGEDFARAGGHSLAAVRLASLLSARTGVRISLGEILAGATPETIALRVRLARGGGAVVTRSGTARPEDDAATVVLVPGMGGEVGPLAETVRALQGRRRVIALRASGWSQPDEPTLEGMVRALEAALQQEASSPDEEVVLVGWSLGAVVALHLAAARARAGRAVRGVVALDPRFPADVPTSAEVVRGIIELARRLVPACGDVARALDVLEDHGLLPMRGHGDPDVVVRRLVAEAALAQAPLGPVHAPVTLVRPTQGDHDDLQRAAMRVCAVAERVESMAVEGDHWSLLQVPAAAMVASAVLTSSASRRTRT